MRRLKHFITTLIALTCAAPVFAQDTENEGGGSESTTTAQQKYATWQNCFITTVSDAVSSLDALTDGYYVMRNAGRGQYVCEDADGSLHIRSISGLSNTSSGSNVQSAIRGVDYINYVVYVSKSDNYYHIQFYNGSYLPSVTSNNATLNSSTEAGNYTIGKFESITDGNYFYLEDSKELTTTVTTTTTTDDETTTTETEVKYHCWIDGGGSNQLVGWAPGCGGDFNGYDYSAKSTEEKSKTSAGNNAYLFYPVEISDEVVALTYNIQFNGKTVATETKSFLKSEKPTTVDVSYVTTNLPLTSSGWTYSAVEAGNDDTYTLTITDDSSISKPFEISSSLSDAHWYGMKVRNSGTPKWIACEQASDNILLSSTWKSEIVSMIQGYDHVADALKWCFIGDPYNGFYIYNKCFGKAMATANGTSDGNIVSLTSDASSAKRFDLQYNSTYSSWYLRLNGTTANCVSDYGGGTNANLKFWNSASNWNDDGSKIVFADPDFTTSNLPSLTNTSESYVGHFTTDNTSDLTGEALYNALNLSKLEKGHFYKIRASRSDVAYAATQNRWISSESILDDTTGTINNSDDNRVINRTTENGAEIPMLWKFESIDDGGTAYKIRNVNNSCVWGQNQGSGTALVVVNASVEANGWCGHYSLTNVSGESDEWYLACINGSQTALSQQRVNALSGLNATTLGGYSGNDGTDAGFKWYIIPVSSVTLSINSDLHWASVCYPFAAQLPEGLKAYKATAVDDGIKLERLTGETIPANTPMVITDETVTDGNGSYTVTIDYDNTEDAPSDNKFDGATATRSGFSAGDFYALSKADNNSPVFRKNGSAVTQVPANKAYLKADKFSNSDGNGTSALRFVYDGGTTGLERLTTPATGSKAYYDLNGHRVLYPTTGVYVTANGEKVFIK